MAEILNVNGVQIEQISSRSSKWRGGISGTFRYAGVEFDVVYTSDNNLKDQIKKHIKIINEELGIKSSRSHTKSAGKRYGRPRGSDEYRKQLAAIFGKAEVAAAATAVAANAKITEQAVKDMLGRVYITRGKYNIYSGNLDRAYLATLVQGRNIIGQYRVSNPPKGNGFEPSPRGRRMRVRLFPPERHKLGMKSRRGGGKKKYGRERYRYKNWFERKNGYDNTGITVGSNRVSGFGYGVGDNRNRVQSGIIIENMAPYAGAVQAKGYRVMPFGIERSYAGRALAKQKQLLLQLPKKMILAAGLK
jgi:hypothetical protein